MLQMFITVAKTMDLFRNNDGCCVLYCFHLGFNGLTSNGWKLEFTLGLNSQNREGDGYQVHLSLFDGHPIGFFTLMVPLYKTAYLDGLVKFKPCF